MWEISKWTANQPQNTNERILRSRYAKIDDQNLIDAHFNRGSRKSDVAGDWKCDVNSTVIHTQDVGRPC